MNVAANVIKYEGSNDIFVWKHPCEDFNSYTQLIVHESQEAIFMMNGQTLDLFGAGRYTLKTQNIPQIGKLLNKLATDETPFHCEVYYINKTVQMSVKWGTDTKVRFTEPTYGVPIEIGACGELNLMVSDSRKLLVKLVGTMQGVAWGAVGDGFTKSLESSFRPLISTAVKANLAKCIREKNIDIFNIDENLELLSKELRKSLVTGFEEYGLTIPNFFVTHVALPENDCNFKRMSELRTISLQKKMVEADMAVRTAIADSDAQVTVAERRNLLEKETTTTEIARREAERNLIKAQAEAQAAKMAGFVEAEVMHAKGFDGKDILQAEVQKAYAEGLGNMSGGGDVLGLGVGMAAAGTLGAQVVSALKGNTFLNNVDGNNSAEQKMSFKTAKRCPVCHEDVPENSKFCLSCGNRMDLLSDDEIQCPACKQVTKKGKFCIHCGALLKATCENCGAELPNNAKYCLECGKKL